MAHGNWNDFILPCVPTDVLSEKQGEIMSGVFWLEKEGESKELKLGIVLKERSALSSDAEQKCQPAGLDPKESKSEFEVDF